MDIIASLDEARARRNVLEHPFYQRWSAGELERDELVLYAGEYRHAVVALAGASRRAATQAAGSRHADELARHAVEEEAHVALWDGFAQALARLAGSDAAPGATGGAAAACDEPLASTRDCAQAWAAGEDLLESLAVLYAVEAGQPVVSQTKLDGLAEYYGVPEDSTGAAYFRLHAKLDVEHARQARELIGELMPVDPEEAQAVGERMLARAQAALEGNWGLLDGVEEAPGVSSHE